MCNSPVVRAESLRFKEEGVNDVVKEIFLPLFNAYRFLVQEVSRFETVNGVKFVPSKSLVRTSDNFTDKWIYACAQSMISQVTESFQKYELYAVAPKLLNFLENLTNWYVRMNRDRMRGNMGKDSAETSLNVLFDVVFDLVVLMAPITPFITEHIYTNLKNVLPKNDKRNQLSVHFVMFPDVDLSAIGDASAAIIRAVANMQQVVLLGRKIRELRCVNLKTPVQSVTVISSDPLILGDIVELESYICDELNSIEVKVSSDVSGIETVIKPNFSALKERFSDDSSDVDFGKLIKTLSEALRRVTPEQVAALSTPGGFVSFESVLDGGVEFSATDLLITRDVSKIPKSDPNMEYGSNAGNAVVVVDFTPKPDLIKTAMAREVANKVQKLRKSIGLNMNDDIEIFLNSILLDGVTSPNEIDLSTVLVEKRDYIEGIIKKPVIDSPPTIGEVVVDTVEDLNEHFKVGIKIVRGGRR
jgi:isoleucyl-tRNA synthetase